MRRRASRVPALAGLPPIHSFDREPSAPALSENASEKEPSSRVAIGASYDGGVAIAVRGLHTLVLYGSSARADSALRRVIEAVRESGGRVTVLSLAPQESESSGCCDRRSVLWNEVCRNLAREDLASASKAVDGDENVELDVLALPGRRRAEVVAREALARRADEIVLADPRTSGLGHLERRRLRRRSPVPVSE